MKKFFIAATFFLAIFSWSADSEAVVIPSVDVTLSCPNSVAVGAPVPVTATIENWDGLNAVSIKRAMVFMGGNSGGTIGTTGLWGPIQRIFRNPVVVPVASSDPVTWMYTPGSVQKRISVRTVPQALAGQMAIAGVEFLTLDGNSIGGGSCIFRVK